MKASCANIEAFGPRPILELYRNLLARTPRPSGFAQGRRLPRHNRRRASAIGNVPPKAPERASFPRWLLRVRDRIRNLRIRARVAIPWQSSLFSVEAMPAAELRLNEAPVVSASGGPPSWASGILRDHARALHIARVRTSTYTCAQRRTKTLGRRDAPMYQAS